MRIVITLLICWLVSADTFAQYENVWVFGNNHGLDFTNGDPVPIRSRINTSEGCASVCDDNGQLLFYTDGSTCYDRNNNVMLNGNNIIAPFSSTSTSQGALIVQMPDSIRKYYLFSMTHFYADSTNHGRLYYSVINMDMNNGLGDIEQHRKGILIDTGLTEHMTGVGGDRCNIWLLVISEFDTLKAFSINNKGIDFKPVKSSIVRSGNLQPWYGILGCIDVAPDRHKIAIARTNLVLYDFDPFKGTVTNPIVLSLSNNDRYDYYSSCFSPDNSKLYALDGFSGDFHQFDLASNDSMSIINSGVHFNRFSPFMLSRNNYGAIKRGPNGKIYINGSNPIGVVNFPNLADTMCSYLPLTDLWMGRSESIGFPNVIPLLQIDSNNRTWTNTIVEKCKGDKIVLYANPDVGYHMWNTGSTDSFLSVDSLGTYWVRSVYKCSIKIDTFIVRYYDYKHLPALKSYSGCKGDAKVMASATPEPWDTTQYTYTWRHNMHLLKSSTHRGPDTLDNISAGTYELTIAAQNVCDTTLYITVPPPVYNASFETDTAICQEDVISFINTSSGDFYSWLWQFGDGDTATAKAPLHSYHTPGIYTATLIARTPYPCYDTAYLVIQVDTMPTVSFLTADDHICEGAPLSFYPRYTSGAENLLWNFGNIDMKTTDLQPVYSFDSSGQWIVSLTGQYPNCPDAIFSDTITVYPYPHVSLGGDTSVCVSGESLCLTTQTPQSPVYKMQWNTGDTSATIWIKHPGIYSLQVTTEHGCITSDSVEIFKSCYLDIPNVFTPNADGNNDYFFPRQHLSRQLTSFHMQILNRWGQLLFETNIINGRGWDGRYNNNDQPAGVYIYQIKITQDSKQTQKYQGNVTLIR